MKKSKFNISSQIPVRFRIKEFFTSLLFWKGRNKGMIHTRNIVWDDLRYIFFPRGFEKYGYLGITFYNTESDLYKAIYPLVLAMDYEAKPKWCPRWFLRFLHVFGSDRSIVRVRNWTLHDLLTKLTKGIQFWDYKVKWANYDLRISISAPEHLQNLASDIERGYYSRGRQKELVEEILKLDPNASIIWGSVERFEKQLEKLEQRKNIVEIMKADEKDGLYES